MTHTPKGNVVADSMNVGEQMNRHVSYTGSAVSMYAHMGTHIDALNHFGLNGKIWNGFTEEHYLGDRGWTVTGAEKLPPIIARGVLIDVAVAKGLSQLPDNYRVTRQDLHAALAQQKITLELVDLEALSRDKVYQFAFIGAPLKFRGGDAAPIRPVALPIR